MASEPMQFSVRSSAHIIAQEHDPRGAEMQRDVHGLMSGVSSLHDPAVICPPACRHPVRIGLQQHPAAIAQDVYVSEFGVLAANFERLGLYLRANRAPPAGVGGVKDVGPWGEADSVVDGEHSEVGSAGSSLGEIFDIGSGEAWTSSDADDG